MVVRIDYNLIGRGWSECVLQVDDKKIVLIASYLSDALYNLLYATIRIVKDLNCGTVKFQEEPGEYRWILTRLTKDRLNIRILWFGNSFSTQIDEEGKVIFEAECRLRTFAGAVLSASQKLLEEYGMEGYKEEWVNHEFPIHLQLRLKKALKNKH